MQNNFFNYNDSVMRYFSFIVILVVIALPINVHAETFKSVILWLSSGKQVMVLLESEPKVTFSADDVRITTRQGIEYIYSSSVVQKYTFSSEGPSGIININCIDSKFSVDGGTVKLSNFSPFSTIYVYNTNGALILKTTSNLSGEAKLSLTNNQGGIYIIKTHDISFKIHVP